MIPMSHLSEILRAIIQGLIAVRRKYIVVPTSYREKEVVIVTTASFQFVGFLYFFCQPGIRCRISHQFSKMLINSEYICPKGDVGVGDVEGEGGGGVVQETLLIVRCIFVIILPNRLYAEYSELLATASCDLFCPSFVITCQRNLCLSFETVGLDLCCAPAVVLLLLCSCCCVAAVLLLCFCYCATVVLLLCCCCCYIGAVVLPLLCCSCYVATAMLPLLCCSCCVAVLLLCCCLYCAAAELLLLLLLCNAVLCCCC
jgi:hypothetical protein